MSLFNDKINTILEKTSLNANELKPLDFIFNTNPDCDHYKSKGIVMKVKPMKDKTGTIGNLVRYMVVNKGDNYLPGDILDKTEIQLDKLEEEEESKLTRFANMVQGALDIAGLEPTIGTAADATNAIISTLRAAIAKEPNMRKKHMMNAGISAVSMLPFADVAKLAKLRSIRKPLTKGLKAVKGYAKKQKSPLKDRFGVTNEGLWANINKKKKSGKRSSPKGSKAYKAAKAAGEKLEANKKRKLNEQLKPRPNIKADPKELAMGIKVEKEHTTSEKAAKTIALQHLAEDPKYYSKLKKVEGNVHENYADGKVKGKSRPGRVKRSGASCKGSVTSLRAKAKKAGGEKGKMYHWCANMKGGKKK